jgi:two-component system sensor histidine kinase AgrC
MREKGRNPMLFYLEFSINFLIALSCAYIVYLLLKKRLNFRPYIWSRILVILALCFSFGPRIYSEEVTGTLSTLVLLLLAVFLAYTDDALVKLSSVLLLYPIHAALSYLTEDLGFLCWLYVFHGNITPGGELALHTGTMVLRLLSWILVYRLAQGFFSDKSLLFPRKMWPMIDLICLTTFFGIITLIYQVDTDHSYTIYPACAACILANIGICRLCVYIAQSARDAMEAELLKSQKAYYEELEASQAETRHLKHDMKNHLAVARTLLKNGQTHHAQVYLADLSGQLHSETLVFCQHPVLNAVLNVKYQLARSVEIQCEFHVEAGQDMGIDDVSLCALAANTLDNAIEACQGVPEPAQRWILLKSRCADGYFSYWIENSKAVPVAESGGKFLTRKKEKDAHGFGLRSVETMVRRYDGVMDISWDKATFSVTVLIPIAGL